MKITYKNYLMVPTDTCKDRLDLYRTGVTAKGKNKQTLIGYGYCFEDAIDKIIRLEIAENKNTITIKDYVSEYRKHLSEVRSLLSEGDMSGNTKKTR
jgi:hypothetical protein